MKKLFLHHRNKLMKQYSKNDGNYLTSLFMVSGSSHLTSWNIEKKGIFLVYTFYRRIMSEVVFLVQVWIQIVIYSVYCNTFLHFCYFHLKRRSQKQVISYSCVCLFQDRTCISSVICRDLVCAQWCQVVWEVIVHFVDIG